MYTFLRDLRYGARLLRRSPGFTFVAVAALAIGIGANLTIFGFASALLLRPPSGVADPGGVVRAFTNRFSNTAYTSYEAYRDRNHTFVALAAFRGEFVSFRTAGAPEQLFAMAVSGNYFAALGVPATIGRPIVGDDDRPGAAGVLMLSDRFWRVRFAANPQAIGQTLSVNGRLATIIGVAPPGFTGTMAPLVPDIWIPVHQSPRGDTASAQMIGRLRPGVTIDQAQADLLTLATQLTDGRETRAQRPMVTVYQARTLAPEIAVPAAIFAGFLLVASAAMVYTNGVSPGHFRTLGIPIVAGRDFDARDAATATPVAIVNESLARTFWPGESAVGQRLRDRSDRQASEPWLEVIGVVRNSRYATVGEEPKAFLYRPIAQAYTPAATLIVKSASAPMDALPRVRAAVGTLDPNLPVFGVMTLDAATSVSLLPVKVAAAVAGALGVLALVLGAIGLYGVMSSVVRQRTREIGIRMALGAHAGAVVRLVTARGMRWTAIGIAVGLGVSLAVATLIASFLYGVSPVDPLTFSAIPLLLAAAAYAACYVPARRASRIDPLAALRDE